MPPARDVADGECVRLWRTTDERKRYDDFATLYALARALATDLARAIDRRARE